MGFTELFNHKDDAVSLGVMSLVQQVATGVVPRMELGRTRRTPQVVIGQGADGVAVDPYLIVEVAR